MLDKRGKDMMCALKASGLERFADNPLCKAFIKPKDVRGQLNAIPCYHLSCFSRETLIAIFYFGAFNDYWELYAQLLPPPPLPLISAFHPISVPPSPIPAFSSFRLLFHNSLPCFFSSFTQRCDLLTPHSTDIYFYLSLLKH